jgi:hypothetical protein
MLIWISELKSSRIADRGYVWVASVSRWLGFTTLSGWMNIRLTWPAERQNWSQSFLPYKMCRHSKHVFIPLYNAAEILAGNGSIWPPLWSSGQSSWLQIQRSGFDSWCYQIFWEVVGLERGPLSLVSTIEELLGRKSSGSGLENREHGNRDPFCWLHYTNYPQKLALSSPTSGGLSVDIVRSRTQATDLFIIQYKIYWHTNFGAYETN